MTAPAAPDTPDADLLERLRRLYTGITQDVLRAMGQSDTVLPAELRPLFPQQVLAGPAFTVTGALDPTAEAHDTLLAWTGLLSQAPAGHVWVSQPHDLSLAHMGELSAETLAGKGLLGCVVDGLIRDTRFIQDLGWQCWSRGFTPRDIVGAWRATAAQVPIRIGAVMIQPGDILHGDQDGLIRIPQQMLRQVVEEAERLVATENLVRSAIRKGMDPQEAYLKHRKF